MKRLLLFTACLLAAAALRAQAGYWQQRVNYEMTIDMDAARHQYQGRQRLTYTNNSPDTLNQVFYHLHFNAFQPNSMMDVRSRTIADPDARVADRISKLKSDEQGYIKVKSLQQDGQTLRYATNETILEVALARPLAPGASTVLEMTWDAQVPLQVRRSGRDNREGIEFSMTQWYPKLAEYDAMGWHATPYIAREFYGVWGDFDVTISIDKKYVVAAGGYLQNPQEVGHGYEAAGQAVQRPAGDKLRWHFKAPNVHDFAWAADPDYAHTKITADDGTTMRFFWQKGQGYDEQWQQLPAIMNRARTIMNERFGKYPYQEYAFIQGGDGGMEYPLATLITGKRPLGSLVGVAVHEHLHSWYQMILGTNESLYAWMDEGFTSYAETIVENELARAGVLPGAQASDNPFAGNYGAYVNLATSGQEEPLTVHADRFNTNFAYSLAAYVKGCVFVRQLEYVLGAENVRRGMLRYFDTWKFKHPTALDFVRVMEKQSGLELDWYWEEFVNTTNTVDYAVDSIARDGRRSTHVVVRRLGRIAMPLDIVVTYTDGSQEVFYAPLQSMLGEKPAEGPLKRTVLPDHRWVEPTYEFDLPRATGDIAKIEIDPTHRMADVDYSNNTWEK
jgi:quercetin dioxygenase-like cupin family protein